MLLFRDSSQRLLFIVGTKRASFLVDDALCASSRVNERVKTYAEPAHCPQLLSIPRLLDIEESLGCFSFPWGKSHDRPPFCREGRDPRFQGGQNQGPDADA
jgi:hypothetical protein